jgi:hypothetical protein
VRTRLKIFILAAVTSFVSAGALFSIAQLAVVFAPCRMFYRTHQPIQDSAACHVFMLIGPFVLILALVSLTFAAVAVRTWSKLRLSSKNHGA